MNKKYTVHLTGGYFVTEKNVKAISILALILMLFCFVSCSNYIGTKAPSEAKEVGDIVFSDGSAMPYTAFAALDDNARNEKKTSAIAIIFYKGTGLNSGDDTTTSRTLGVGLRHNRNGFEWCKKSADAYSVNITTIQCPANGRSGALIFTGDKNGSDNLEQIEAFAGVDDTAMAAKYPAFYFAKNYKDQTGTTNGFNLDAASRLCGGASFANSYYWSSTQLASSHNEAYRLYFPNGSWDIFSKTHNDYVCAIREF